MIKTRMYTVIENVNRDTGEIILQELTKNYIHLYNEPPKYTHNRHNGVTRKFIRRIFTEHGKQLSIL